MNNQKFGEWISVKERLPEKDGFYIIYHKGLWEMTIFFGFWNQKSKIWSAFGSSDNDEYAQEVTHWMPLPDPPGVQEEHIKDWFEKMHKARDEAGLGSADLTGPWPHEPPKEKEVTGGYFCLNADQEFRDEVEIREKMAEGEVAPYILKRLDALEDKVGLVDRIYKMPKPRSLNIYLQVETLEKKVKELKEIKDKLHDMNIYELHERFVGVEKRLTGHSIHCSEKRFDDMEKRNNALEIRLFGKVEPFLKTDENGESYSKTMQINIINQLFDMVAELSRKVDNFQHTDCKIMKSLKEKA